MFYNYGFITGVEPQRWTIGAIQCYKRGCNCSGCFLSETYYETLGHGRCSMKIAVRKLIKKCGLPKDVTFIEEIEEE